VGRRPRQNGATENPPLSVGGRWRRANSRPQRAADPRAGHASRHPRLKRDADGEYSWKFDPYLRARAPYRLSLEDNIALWSRIQCPTLLVAGSESFLPDPGTAGVLTHFRQAELVKIEGAGHWLQHDKTEEVIGVVKPFLDLSAQPLSSAAATPEVSHPSAAAP
jgi:pimeloyl-ACP methyl ester carboxylesterase